MSISLKSAGGCQMKAIEVIDGLWIRGGLNNNVGTRETVRQLKELGVRAVLSVHPRGEPMLDDQDDIHYKHSPFSDGKKLPVNKDELVEWVCSHGPGVLVTCRAGRNRSGLIVALSLMSILRVDGKTALELLRSKRPGAVANPAFEAYIEGLYDYDC